MEPILIRYKKKYCISTYFFYLLTFFFVSSLTPVPNKIIQTANIKGAGKTRIKYKYLCNVKKTVDVIYVHTVITKIYSIGYVRNCCLKYDNSNNYIIQCIILPSSYIRYCCRHPSTWPSQFYFIHFYFRTDSLSQLTNQALIMMHLLHLICLISLLSVKL